MCLICLPFDIFLLIINSFSLSVLHAFSKHLQCFDSCWQWEVKCQQQLEINGKSITLLYFSVCLCGDDWAADPLTFSVTPLTWKHIACSVLSLLIFKQHEEKRWVKNLFRLTESAALCPEGSELVPTRCSAPQRKPVCSLFPHNTTLLQRDTNTKRDKPCVTF